MSKTTIAIIVIIYALSIFWVGFFGLSFKVVDKVKYVDSIQVKVEAESQDMFKLKDSTKRDEQGNKKAGEDYEYNLTIYYKQAHIVYEGKNYLPLSIIPQVTYMSGDLASTDEKIKFVLDDEMKEREGRGELTFSNGQLVLYDPPVDDDIFSFRLKVSPEHSSRNGSSALVKIMVINFDQDE